MKFYLYIFVTLSILSNQIYSQWIFQNSGVFTNLYEVFFLDEFNGWSVGADGVILKTTNGGTNWNIIASGTNAAFGDIQFFNLNNGILTGSNGTIKKSTDGGLNWFDINSGVSQTLQRFSFIDSNNGWICGDGGLILKTTNGGDTWTIQAALTAYYLLGIWFNDANTGWICTSFNGEIWKTTDGGNNWSYKYETPSNEHLSRIQFVNDNVGWAVGDGGLILKSTDGGESWFEQNSGTGKAFFGFSFYNNIHGFVVGQDENILRTTDGGNNWIIDRSGSTPKLYAVYFLDQNFGWATGSNGTILYTDNWGGFPFQTLPISILAPNGGEILIAGSTYFIEWTSQNVVNVKIEYSTDNGTNWVSIIDSIPSTGIYEWTVSNTHTTEGRVKISDLTDPNIFDISDLSFTIQSSKVITVISPNGGEILDGGSQIEILWSSEDVEYVKLEYSINNGASWNSITDSTESTGAYLWIVPNILTTQARIKISDISLPSIYDASDDPFRINYVVSVDENVMITVYKLHQNFPNPFNPLTNVKYQIPKLSFVTIKIYDVLGNEIAELVNEEKAIGSYKVEFNASDLPSGIYFYRIQAGSFIDTKKMIIVK
jgi:photosystem II stability/assembly factor-like uncharacterized protein